MPLSRMLSAMSDPTRHKILEMLKKKDMPAGRIGQFFPITAPSLSHHLGVLKQAGLISSRRDGQEIIYSLNLSVFEELAEYLVKFFKIKK
jgi:ArsR family transcriptional regulator, arsenate/arsenite/antimonite-responsive transcriptional repressor